MTPLMERCSEEQSGSYIVIVGLPSLIKKIHKIHRYSNNGYEIPVLAQYLIAYNFSKKENPDNLDYRFIFFLNCYNQLYCIMETIQLLGRNVTHIFPFRTFSKLYCISQINSLYIAKVKNFYFMHSYITYYKLLNTHYGICHKVKKILAFLMLRTTMLKSFVLFQLKEMFQRKKASASFVQRYSQYN